MKKFFVILLLICFVAVLSIPAFAAGVAGFSQQKTLYSQATGTTAAVTTDAFTFDYPVSKIACDLIVAPLASASTVTFQLDGNQGSSTTLFDTGTVYAITAKTLTSSATLTVMKTMATVDIPLRTIAAKITMPTTTGTVTVNCTGMQ